MLRPGGVCGYVVSSDGQRGEDRQLHNNPVYLAPVLFRRSISLDFAVSQASENVQSWYVPWVFQLSEMKERCQETKCHSVT